MKVISKDTSFFLFKRVKIGIKITDCVFIRYAAHNKPVVFYSPKTTSCVFIGLKTIDCVFIGLKY